MPAPALTPLCWQGLSIERDESGLLGTVTDADSGRELARQISIVLPEPWRVDPDDPLAWTHPGCRARAEWLITEEDWQLRVVLEVDEPVTVPGPLLGVSSDWPVQRLAVSGRHSAVLLDPRRDRGEVVALTAVHRSGDWTHPLDGSAVQLRPSRLPRQLTWQAHWLTTPSDLDRLLPPWFPDRCAVEVGDLVELRLPDAGIDCDSLPVQISETGALLEVGAGRHRISVHEPATTSSFDVFARPAEPAAALVEVAHEAQRRGWTSADPASPLLVVSLAAQLAGGESPGDDDAGPETTVDRANQLEAAVRQMTPGPGMLLAHARASIVLQWLGRELPALPPLPSLEGDALLATSLRAEWQVLSGAARPDADVQAMVALLGRRLPVQVIDPHWASVWVALLRLAPEHWEFEVAAGGSRAALIDEVEIRLLAESAGHQSLSWLLLR